MKNFNNKVAAITGAGSGIGQQLAVLLAQQGCHLALSDINEQGLAQTLELLKESDVRVTIQKVNVAELEQVRNWAAQVEQDHGSVNMIFNNAGLQYRRYRPTPDPAIAHGYRHVPDGS